MSELTKLLDFIQKKLEPQQEQINEIIYVVSKININSNTADTSKKGSRKGCKKVTLKCQE